MYFKQFANPIRLYFLLAAVSLTLLIPQNMQAAETSSDYESLLKTQNAFIDVAEKVSSAVVYIEVEKVIEQNLSMVAPSPFNDPFDLFNDEFFERFFRHQAPKDDTPRNESPKKRQYHQVGQGSGFIISEEGYILTNNHVVGDADRIRVKLSDGREFEAERIGTDPESDVGVIKIKGSDLPTLKMGDSDSIRVGEWVIAVGNPFGLSRTVTSGIVSAKGRSNVGITEYEDFIQTDAAINPGNSGGPLVNLKGEVIGVNTAIFSRSGGYMGIGFAIPINMANSIYKQLIDTGSVKRGFLGIVIQDMTADLANSFGWDESKGILISDVTEDSPAEKAGLKQGDIITKLNGKPIKSSGAFRNQIAMLPPETKVSLTVIQNKKEKTISVTTGERPEDEETIASQDAWMEKLGFTVQNLTSELAERFDYQNEKGVIVTEVEPGSIAALAGIRPGTLIQGINQEDVNNMSDFERLVKETIKDERILLLVKDGRYSRFVVLRLE